MIIYTSGVKKSQNDHLSCIQVLLSFYLPSCQITLGIQLQGNIALHCIFLLVRPTLDENICLSWLKFLIVSGSRTSDFFTPVLDILLFIFSWQWEPGLSIPVGNLAILTAIPDQVAGYSNIYIKHFKYKKIFYIIYFLHLLPNFLRLLSAKWKALRTHLMLNFQLCIVTWQCGHTTCLSFWTSQHSGKGRTSAEFSVRRHDDSCAVSNDRIQWSHAEYRYSWFHKNWEDTRGRSSNSTSSSLMFRSANRHFPCKYASKSLCLKFLCYNYGSIWKS